MSTQNENVNKKLNFQSSKMGDIKSLRSDHQINANFKNVSQRTVDLYWVDFNGGLVLYCKDMKPQQELYLQTYVTHPWVARDSETGQRLMLSGQPVYVVTCPIGEVDAHIQHVHMGALQIEIHIPAYRLEEICIGFFRKHLGPSKVTGLEVNNYLMEKLVTIPNPSARVYRRREGITDN